MYASTSRDSLLAAVLDVLQTEVSRFASLVGNIYINVKVVSTEPGHVSTDPECLVWLILHTNSRLIALALNICLQFITDLKSIHIGDDCFWF